MPTHPRRSRRLRVAGALVAFTFAAVASACGGHRNVNGSVRDPSQSLGYDSDENVAIEQALAAFALSESAAIANTPVSLTASDGSGLRVEELIANVHVHGPLALTEVRTTFVNPSNTTTLEGRFRITLPPRSSMMRLAMKISGEWREADAAELGAARETYEEILHRRRDPLLVEMRREREISARVFPIFPNEHKEIAVTYVSEIGPDAPVTFPLRGLPVVDKLHVSIIEGATEPFGLHLEHERPTTDVQFVPQTTRGVRAGNLVAIRVPTQAPSEPDPISGPVVVLIETSASKDLDGAASLLASIAPTLGDAAAGGGGKGGAGSKVRTSVVAYDQSTERLYDGELAQLPSSLAKALAARGAMGASDLERGLTAAAEEARRIHATRVVIVGGGAPTVGVSDPKRLREVAVKIAAAGVERLDVLATSALADARVYRPLAMGGLFARDGVVVEDAPRLDHALVTTRLTHRVTNVPVVVEGATWSSVSSFDASSPGDERVVLAVMAATAAIAAPDAPVRVRVGDKTTTFDASAISAAPRNVIDHSIAAAKLNGLVAKGERAGWEDPLLRRDVLALSRQHRLASPLTALIVLESQADRATLRSKEARNANPAPDTPTAMAVQPAAGVTRSTTRRMGSHIAKAPSLRMGSTTVNGRVPPEVIQRQVRNNMGVFRACYEDGLRRRGPKLAGRVAVRFVIGRDGRVEDAQDGGSDIDDPAVIACIVSGFRRLEFPEPPSGIITVVYPIVLSPRVEGEPDAESPPQKLNLPITTPRALPTNNPFNEPQEPPPPLLPWSPDYANVMNLLQAPSNPSHNNKKRAAGAGGAAINAAIGLRSHDAANPIALVAMGQAFEAVGDADRASRAYGSLADLYPERAEMLRAAAVRIDRMRPNDPIALSLLRRAVADRPDQPSSHHLLALALLRAGAFEAAFEAIAAGMGRRYELRYASIGDLFATDLGLIAAAWSKADPKRASTISTRASALGARIQDRASVRAIASWETDTSDVDMLVNDAKGDPRGAIISYATDGFGPEALDVPVDDAPTAVLPADDVKKTRAQPFTAALRLRRRGSGGDVLGVVDIVKHDGRGDVTVEPRPFAIMTESSILQIGAIE